MGGRTELRVEGVDTGSWNWKERLKSFEVGYGPSHEGELVILCVFDFSIPLVFKKSTRYSFGNDLTFSLFIFLGRWT